MTPAEYAAQIVHLVRANPDKTEDYLIRIAARLVRDAIEEEREACAKVAADLNKFGALSKERAATAQTIAEAIRFRTTAEALNVMKDFVSSSE